jgi:hypothetical protein
MLGLHSIYGYKNFKRE